MIFFDGMVIATHTVLVLLHAQNFLVGNRGGRNHEQEEEEQK